ncbi:MAG: hypothetical protein IJ708_08585, partial [Clostridia bacterium]|nr:hypothetical protein [Clostridia bacterium]
MRKTWIILGSMLLLLCTLNSSFAETNEEKLFSQAMSQLSQAKYEEAAQSFDQLGAYSDAPLWAMYSRALQNIEDEAYALASVSLEQLGDFNDSQLRLQEVLSLSYEQVWDYESALKVYRAYPNYLDFAERAKAIPEKIRDREYRIAEGYEEAGKLQEALDAFNALLPYRDSTQRAAALQKQIVQAAYEAAEALEQEGALEAAYNAFTEVVPYADSESRAEKILETMHAQSYAEAERLEQAEDFYSAYQLFLSLKDYQDSRERAQALQDRALYAYGTSLVHEGHYSQAYAVFSSLEDYLDSEKKSYALGVVTFAEETRKLSSERFAYCFHDLWALVNFTTCTVMPAYWDDIQAFDLHYALVTLNGSLGLLDEEGEIVLSPKYARIEPFDQYGFAKISVKAGDGLRLGLINRDAEIVLSP